MSWDKKVFYLSFKTFESQYFLTFINQRFWEFLLIEKLKAVFSYLELQPIVANTSLGSPAASSRTTLPEV